ncbi:hypothetical protein PG996_015676 [Apiospora saccharicola]|uniref:Uncharacterized protein n=1 Tax=Apiospora saccharicola TaxID=335842 RepID=A0ABR1TLY1_9PEZI
MSSTETGEDSSFQGDGSNWTIAYVIVFLIPLIFLAVAVYSTWQDRRTAAAKAKNDLETGRAVKMDRYFFPWKYAAEAADGSSSSNATRGKNGANRSNLAIATTSATAASGAAGSTSARHSNNPRALASSSRGGNTNSNMAPIAPWFALPEQRPISVMTNPYRPSYYQQQNRAQQHSPQQHSPKSKVAAAATSYLPRPTTSISDEADATTTGHLHGAEEDEEQQSTWKDGSDLRYV